MKPRFTLSKAERLSSDKEIDLLFKTGQGIMCHPVRLVWLKKEVISGQEHRLVAMFNTSKKKFPRAVDRNRIKRLLRESYRLIKPELETHIKDREVCHLAFIYVGNELPAFEEIQKAMRQALERWLKKINQG